jgi:hypothetical protein
MQQQQQQQEHGGQGAQTNNNGGFACCIARASADAIPSRRRMEMDGAVRLTFPL